MKKFLATAVSIAAMLVAPATSAPAGESAGSAFDFSFKSIDGSDMPLAQWRGKVLLVVNTASFCGYTKQYSGLQELWSKYEEKGLVVIGVPSNDFGGQEPKGEAEIKNFCQGAFGVTFPLTEKQTVVGDGAHPFYAWARAAGGKDAVPSWNFHKFLIGRDGRLVRSISTRTPPTSDEVIALLESALAAVPATN